MILTLPIIILIGLAYIISGFILGDIQEIRPMICHCLVVIGVILIGLVGVYCQVCF